MRCRKGGSNSRKASVYVLSGDCQEASSLAACVTSKPMELSSWTTNFAVAHLVYLDHPENSVHKRPAWRTWRAELIFARGESSFEFFLLRHGDPRTWPHGLFCHAGFIRGRRDPLGTGLWEQVLRCWITQGLWPVHVYLGAVLSWEH